MPDARELWQAVWAAVDRVDEVALLPQLCSPDVRIRTPHHEHQGVQKLVELFAQQRGLYTGFVRTVDSIVESADGTAVSVELSLSGVPRGTDQRLAWNVVETVRAEQDRIVSWHAMLDRTWLVGQVQALYR